jgi:zinc transport system ATP-binding protein
MGKPIVKIEDVWFHYNNHPVLTEVNMVIYPKDFIELIGPNGGGKTTLLKLMLGLLNPDRGTVRIFGCSPAKVSHRIGYVPQDVNANKNFPITVTDVVLMGRLTPKWKCRRYSKKDKEAVLSALEKLEMTTYADHPIGELSGGQRQRVFIARALVSNPEILFLDEPTANVDAHGQTELFTLLKQLNQHTTILVVSHDFLAVSSYIKSVTCVNQDVHQHDAAEVTQEMLDLSYQCPVELVAHGLPHRVLQKH